MTADYQTIFYEYGWWCDYDQESMMSYVDRTPQVGSSYRMDAALDEIAQIVALCKENNVELVVFTNPLCRETWEASLELNYLDFLKGLSEITDYYNFSGMNDVTDTDDSFIDMSHYTAQVGDLMLASITGNGDQALLSQGFGYYVTKANVDDFIELLMTNK